MLQKNRGMSFVSMSFLGLNNKTLCLTIPTYNNTVENIVGKGENAGN